MICVNLILFNVLATHAKSHYEALHESHLQVLPLLLHLLVVLSFGHVCSVCISHYTSEASKQDLSFKDSH